MCIHIYADIVCCLLVQVGLVLQIPLAIHDTVAEPDKLYPMSQV